MEQLLGDNRNSFTSVIEPRGFLLTCVDDDVGFSFDQADF
jgi:hypothetical protein